jgi:hypothetical protein
MKHLILNKDCKIKNEYRIAQASPNEIAEKVLAAPIADMQK